eukprot:5565626-Prymnesium_polylepis.1
MPKSTMRVDSVRPCASYTRVWRERLDSPIPEASGATRGPGLPGFQTSNTHASGNVPPERACRGVRTVTPPAARGWPAGRARAGGAGVVWVPPEPSGAVRGAAQRFRIPIA